MGGYQPDFSPTAAAALTASGTLAAGSGAGCGPASGRHPAGAGRPAHHPTAAVAAGGGGNSQPPLLYQAGAAGLCSLWQLRVDQGTLALIALAQAAMVAQWKETSAHPRHPYAVVFLAITSVAVCGIILWPNTYRQHRTWMLPVLRTLLYAVPSARSMGVGTASTMERPPLPGVGGALLNAARIGAGTRAGMLCVQGVLLLLPPAAALITQAALVLLTTNPTEYCSTQLLRHPASQRHLARLAWALDEAALPLKVASLTLTPVGAPGEAPSAEAFAGPTQARCQALLSFAHLAVGLVLPTLVSLYCWCPPPPAPEAEAPAWDEDDDEEEEEEEEKAQGSGGGDLLSSSGGGCGMMRSGGGGCDACGFGSRGDVNSSSGGDSSSGGCGCDSSGGGGWGSWAQQMRRTVRHAACGLNGALYDALEPFLCPAGMLAGCWWLLSFCWLCCQLAAGLL